MSDCCGWPIPVCVRVGGVQLALSAPGSCRRKPDGQQEATEVQEAGCDSGSERRRT